MKRKFETKVDNVTLTIEYSRTRKTICISAQESTVKYIGFFKSKNKLEILHYIYYLHLMFDFKVQEKEYFEIIKLIS